MKRVPPRPTASRRVGDTPTLTASLPVPPFGDGTRSRAVRAHPETTTASPTKRTRSRQTWRCHNCGQILTSWAAAERHADTHLSGARLDLDLDPGPDSAA